VEATERTGEIKSVLRALSLLTAFSMQETELSVSELAQRRGMHKSTVSRLLATLETQGFVRQDPKTSRYSLGFRLLELASIAVSGFDVRQIARPMLESISRECEETASLAIFDGRDAVTIDMVIIPRSIQYVGWVGRRAPPHCTSLGKVLLAWQPALAVEQFLRAPLARFTERTVTDPALLAAQLESIRSDGYAVADGEFEDGVVGVAAPVFGRAGAVLAAAGISAPAFRTPPERTDAFVPVVIAAAKEISQRLGHATLLPVAGAVQAAPV
jgi:DNA-binding IclR family transcriptional regulator